VGAEPGIAQIAAEVRRLMIRLRIRRSPPSLSAMPAAVTSLWAVCGGSLIGQARDLAFQGMTRSVESYGRSPCIDGGAEALFGPQIFHGAA
jgi:hypothetical protein